MTTLVALATKDALVLGCDSLATSTKKYIDPLDLLPYFDDAREFALRLDAEGKPVLQSLGEIWQKAHDVPYTHMTHMTKLCQLGRLPMGAMATGIVSVGERTVRSLVEEFCATAPAVDPDNDYSVAGVSGALLEFLVEQYKSQYPDEKKWPALELIVGGYDKLQQVPAIVRVKLPENKVEPAGPGFGLVFGGLMKEIQRIVHGTDLANLLRMRERHFELLRKYRERLIASLRVGSADAQTEVPELSMDDLRELDMLADDWKLTGFEANWGDFSNQNAIECVDFFVSIMIKSQQFSSGMPTVGGEVHIALVTKKDGFRFVSREELRHGEFRVPREKGLQ